jgi:hypothetical protein
MPLDERQRDRSGELLVARSRTLALQSRVAMLELR